MFVKIYWGEKFALLYIAWSSSINSLNELYLFPVLSCMNWIKLRNWSPSTSDIHFWDDRNQMRYYCWSCKILIRISLRGNQNRAAAGGPETGSCKYHLVRLQECVSKYFARSRKHRHNTSAANCFSAALTSDRTESYLSRSHRIALWLVFLFARHPETAQ